MRFINTDKGYVNLDHVAEVTVRYDQNGRQKARLWGPDERDLGEAAYRVEDHHFGTIVPASPGYFVVTVDVDDAGHSAWEEPIVAFSITESGPHPLTVEAWPSDLCRWAIKTPSGRVFIPGDESFDTQEAFVAHIVEIVSKARSRVAASA